MSKRVPLLLKALWEDGVLRNILGLYREELLKCSIPILLCPTSKGKELLKKEDLMETWLLRGNQ